MQVPALFFVVDAVPLTPTGKVDRVKAEKVANDRFLGKVLECEEAAACEIAITDTEEALVSIWERMLNIQPISVSATSTIVPHSAACR